MKQLNHIFFLVAFMYSSTITAQIKVTGLTCALRTNPVGVGDTAPAFNWKLTAGVNNVQQEYYQVIVASSVQHINSFKADVWNSGKVKSDRSIFIRYQGPALQSNTTYYWRVKVFTNKGETQWSETAQWTTGLLKENDWKARWIGYTKISPWDSITQWSRLSARYFRKNFQANKKIQSARVYVSGLGLYELYINGKKVGNQVLAPAPTDYRQSFFYQAHDVTALLQQGMNAVGAVAGNGRFFTMRQNYKTQKHNTFGMPQLLLQLEIQYTDGTTATIITDETWKVNTDGPIRTNNEYDGEEYDARKEFNGWTTPSFNDNNWSPVEMVTAPKGKIMAQPNPPMKVMKRLQPVSIKKINGNRYIIDMGQNFSGWIMLKNIKGAAGTAIRLRFAESLQANGELYVANLRDAKVTDVYTLKGGTAESWHPSFVYHGFRYAEVSGFPGTPQPSNFEGQMVYDDISTSASFETSNATINTVYRNAWWGIASNYKGMPVDCPQRNERQPWLGDRAIGAQGESYMFNNAALYYKWMDDIQQSQTAEGAIPDVAPAFWNYYSDNVTWPGTYITINNHLYNQYGDARALQQHYPSMKKWMGYMQQKYMKDYIITKDKYGDWCVPPESLELIHSKDSLRNTDGKLIATAYYFKLLSYMKRFATILNLPEDAGYYTTLADSIRYAFQQKFYDARRKQYSNNTVTANLLPLYFGITPDSVRSAIIDKIRFKVHVENHDHISTGVIGAQWLMRGLTEYDMGDIAYLLATNTTYPSWGYMAANGATTIWELWNGNTADPGMNSQNHVMLLGDLLTWYYENLAGIRPDKSVTGFKKIIMRPFIPAGLSYVKASYESMYGTIRSHWKNSISKFEWNVFIPANTTATIHFPAGDAAEVTVNGVPLTLVKDVRVIKAEKGIIILEVASGAYTFLRNKQWKKGIVTQQFIFERASFPESHAATIAETPAGLITAWFGGTKEGYNDVCIWTSRMINGQWTAPQKVADGVLNDSVRYACYNPVLFYAPNKELLLFYKIGPNVAGWTGWMKRSKDNGLTWSEREKLPDGFLGPIKNKPIMVGDTLICPSSTEKNGWKVHFEYTTDFGKTWSKSAAINDGKTISAIQASILQYDHHVLQVLCRSRNRTINESWSMDGGKTWSPMKASALPNNNSGTDAVTLKDGTQLLVYNHVKPAPELPNGKGARTPLNVAISKNGQQWSAALELEDSPISQYSYPSVIQSSDGFVHIVYTWRRERICYVKIDPKQLISQPIINEQWPGRTNQESGTVTAD